MTFDPMSVEITCVNLPKDHCVQVPWQYINVCGYSDQFCKIPHTYIHILRTYYVQNEWSHSLLLNSVKARQKPVNTKGLFYSLGAGLQLQSWKKMLTQVTPVPQYNVDPSNVVRILARLLLGGGGRVPPDGKKIAKNREGTKSGKKRKNWEEKAKIGKVLSLCPSWQIRLAMLLQT